jgi:polyisoprenoid-binding protein YceI
MKSVILCLLALSLLASMSQAQVPLFQIDHATSTVKFNLSASVPISGTFDKWDAKLTFTSPELATGVLNIKIQAYGVNTGSGVKDGFEGIA